MADAPRRQFASDNQAGICPEAFEAMAEANAGHETGYGDDRWTARAEEMLRELFEADCRAFFVFAGTSANALALAALCRPWHAAVCHQVAHVEVDEVGATAFFSGGMRLLAVPGPEGKVTPAALEAAVLSRDDVHAHRPRALSLTQATELGTVYRRPELEALREVARRHRLKVHVDGARFANAVAELGVAPREITWEAGVDVLCFGGTKNGMAAGEAVIFFDRELAEEFEWRRKQAGQLSSKMRFLAAPWVGLLRSGAWLSNARRANAMARELEAALREVPGVRIVHPRQANAVFADLPPAVRDGLRARGWHFYDFAAWGGARLMCAWDTSPEDVRAFAADAAELARRR